MINKNLTQEHVGQPVIVFLDHPTQFVNKKYGTISRFTEDKIYVIYDGHKKEEEHDYSDVTLDYYSCLYTASDFEDDYKQLKNENSERLKTRLDGMFNKK